MNRRKFITTCASCMVASLGAVYLYENDMNMRLDDYTVRKHVGIHIAEHCNLKCKYCCHFSCIAQKEFYDLDKFKQDIKRMSYIYNKRLLNLELLGGEPLLNPNINEYVKTSRQYFPKARIDILTNATLLDEMDEKFWKTMSENNVCIIPSIYPIKINWKSILDKAKKYNAGIYRNYKCDKILTLDKIEKFETNIFYKMALREKGDNIDKSKCRKRFGCNCMYDGKLYPCFLIAYIRHLNKKFNTNFIVTEDDYIDLYKVKNFDEVGNFLRSPNQFPFCKYCRLNFSKVKWETSSVHTLSEWT